MADVSPRTAVARSRGRVWTIHMVHQALPFRPLHGGFRFTQMAQIQRIRRHDSDGLFLFRDTDRLYGALRTYKRQISVRLSECSSITKVHKVTCRCPGARYH